MRISYPVSDTTAEWFARYRFCQPLGQGGMGVIYLAEDRRQSNTQCVVKQLISKPSDAHEHAEAVRLFRREANILKSLNHPGIVRFSDAHCTEDGKYFLVMDYVPGKNLDSIVSTYGPFNSEAAVEIAIQCCEVLEYIHDQDPPVLYRDLKPSNLMLTPDGQIVFIDFGIARSFMPKEAATRVVTAGYSPPEQYFGKPEIRSDLYALGATLSHLLTGVRPKPLSASNPMMVKPDVNPALDELIRQMTAHNPEDRPVSAREIRYRLYNIYKQINPEFEVPEEALSYIADNNRRPRQTAAPVNQQNSFRGKALTEESLKQTHGWRLKPAEVVQRLTGERIPASASSTKLRAQQQRVSSDRVQRNSSDRARSLKKQPKKNFLEWLGDALSSLWR